MDWLHSQEFILDYKVIVSNNPVTHLDDITVELVTKDGTFGDEDRDILIAQLSDIAGLKVGVTQSESKVIWSPEQGMKPKRLEDRRFDG
jgi:hypothetical protein